MVTDRVSTAGLCAFLAVLYPDEAFMFISLICIDIFSHWFHVIRYAAVYVRSSPQHAVTPTLNDPPSSFAVPRATTRTIRPTSS